MYRTVNIIKKDYTKKNLKKIEERQYCLYKEYNSWYNTYVEAYSKPLWESQSRERLYQHNLLNKL